MANHYYHYIIAMAIIAASTETQHTPLGDMQCCFNFITFHESNSQKQLIKIQLSYKSQE